MAARYTNFAWKGSGAGGVDLPALDHDTIVALASATNATQAANAIRAFIDGFHDGHLSELPYLAEAATSSMEPAKAVLDPAEPVAGCAALGNASTGPVAFSLPLEGLPGFRLLSDGLASTFRTGVVTRSGVTLGVLRIQNFRARAFPMACLHTWADLRQAGAPITPDTVRKATRLRWFQDMATAMSTLRQAGATVLVTDIGNDSGGDDSGDWAARLFTARPVRSARLMMADAPVSARYFAEEIGDLDAALSTARSQDAKAALGEARSFFNRQTAAIGQQRCDLSWVWREQRAWSLTNCNRLIAGGYAGGYSAGLPRNAYRDDEAAIVLSSSATVEAYYGQWTGSLEPGRVRSDPTRIDSATRARSKLVWRARDRHMAAVVRMIMRIGRLHVVVHRARVRHLHEPPLGIVGIGNRFGGVRRCPDQYQATYRSQYRQPHGPPSCAFLREGLAGINQIAEAVATEWRRYHSNPMQKIFRKARFITMTSILMGLNFKLGDADQRLGRIDIQDSQMGGCLIHEVPHLRRDHGDQAIRVE